MLKLVDNSSVDIASQKEDTYVSYGSHGTTKSRAESIMRDGFCVTGAGRRGNGAYFWLAEYLGCQYATRLAEAWYTKSQKKGEYSQDKDPELSIIWGYVSLPYSEVLNTETPLFKYSLRKILEENSDKIHNSQERELLVCQAHQMLIQSIEENLGNTIKVLETIVPQPKMSDEFLPLVGDPFALVVRDLDCLTINIEEVPNEP